MSTSICGQDEINLETASGPLETTLEPIDTPPELWLGNTEGASFPKPYLKESACDYAEGPAKEAGNEEHVPHHTPEQNVQVADNVGI